MTNSKTIPLSHAREIMAMLLFNFHRCLRFLWVFEKHSHMTLIFSAKFVAQSPRFWRHWIDRGCENASIFSRSVQNPTTDWSLIFIYSHQLIKLLTIQSVLQLCSRSTDHCNRERSLWRKGSQIDFLAIAVNRKSMRYLLRQVSVSSTISR